MLGPDRGYRLRIFHWFGASSFHQVLQFCCTVLARLLQFKERKIAVKVDKEKQAADCRDLVAHSEAQAPMLAECLGLFLPRGIAVQSACTPGNYISVANLTLPATQLGRLVMEHQEQRFPSRFTQNAGQVSRSTFFFSLVHE